MLVEVKKVNKAEMTVVSSLDVAETFDKNHKDVMESIRNIESSISRAEFSALFFLDSYRASNGKGKAVEVSTPTIKGASKIETAFYQGTQERWCHQCPECGEYSEIEFDHIKFEKKCKLVKNKKTFQIIGTVYWICPKCGCLIPEETMRKQPAKWIADNPDAAVDGVRSFWLNAFSSPWTSWSKIAKQFIDANERPIPKADGKVIRKDSAAGGPGVN